MRNSVIDDGDVAYALVAVWQRGPPLPGTRPDMINALSSSMMCLSLRGSIPSYPRTVP
jgi:hypothetical protein